MAKKKFCLANMNRKLFSEFHCKSEKCVDIVMNKSIVLALLVSFASFFKSGCSPICFVIKIENIIIYAISLNGVNAFGAWVENWNFDYRTASPCNHQLNLIRSPPLKLAIELWCSRVCVTSAVISWPLASSLLSLHSLFVLNPCRDLFERRIQWASRGITIGGW